MISILVGLIIIGVVLYLITLIPMDAAIQQIIRIVVIVGVILWLLSTFFGGGPAIGHFPRY